MAVDVADLVEQLKSSVNPPGTDLFPNATETDWVNNLRNGFWEATLDGVITGYSESEGEIAPTTGTDELPGDLQQLTILYAAVTIVRNYLLSLDTVFRTKAGPVEYETQKNGPVLKAILEELVRKRTIILTRLADEASETAAYYYDSAIQRNNSMLYGDIYWMGY